MRQLGGCHQGAAGDVTQNLKIEYLRFCNKQPKENFVFYYTAITSQY